MLGKLKLVDYILIVEVVTVVILLGYVIARPGPACIESLDVTRGQNFNQPILTEHNCSPGQMPTNWRDFEAR